MATCARACAALLPHVNLLLTLIGGAGVATAARLKWDPSTYIVVRELLPQEYGAAGVALCAASLALLLLAHLASAALAAPPRARRYLLIVYAVCMAALLVAEVALAAWLTVQVLAWLASSDTEAVDEWKKFYEDLPSLFNYLTEHFQLPEKISILMKEAQADLPRNLYLGYAVLVLTALLQPTAVVLAALAACDTSWASDAHSKRARAYSNDTCSEKSLLASSRGSPRPKLKTTYKNGRLEILHD